MAKKKLSGFDELNEKLDRVIDAMATREDILRLEKRMDVFDRRLSDLVTAVDKLAKSVSDLALEYAAVKTQLARHEEWIRLLAKKAGVNLDV